MGRGGDEMGSGGAGERRSWGEEMGRGGDGVRLSECSER